MKKNGGLWVHICAIASVLLSVFGCSNTTRDEWAELAFPTKNEKAFRDYEITGTTKLGVPYDGNVDEEMLDLLVEQVYLCLGEGSRIDPQWVAAHGQCLEREWSRPSIGSFVVVIEPEYEVNGEGCGTVKGSVLPDFWTRKDGVCKDYNGDDDNLVSCPCGWRSFFREANDGRPLIITTPRMLGFGDALTRWATMCNYPWATDFPWKACAGIKGWE